MLYEIQLNSPFRSFDNADAPSDYNYNYSTNVFDFVEEPETAPEGRTYGVEIELNPVRNNRQNFVNGIHQVFDLSPTFIVKSDSTISEYGGEIVTVPLGLDAMPALFGAIEASAPGQYTVSNACGVHIHAAVPNNIWTLARMYMIVMSRNSLAFGSHVFGRQPGDFHMRGEYTIRPSDAVDWARGRQRGNHRTALEFSNKGTLELRSFAGTTKAADLMCYAEYYDALIEFCSKRVQGVSIDDLNILAQFSAFVLASESRWPALATRLRCGSVEIIADGIPYNNAVRGLFLPRAARTPEPRQPRLPAAILDELNDLTTPGITIPGAQPYTPGWEWTTARNAQTGETTRHRTYNGAPMSEPATPRATATPRVTPRSNGVSGTVAQTLATRRANFRDMVEDRIERSADHALFNRSIGNVGFHGSTGSVVTYAWLLRVVVGNGTLRSTARSIDDYHIEILRTEMYSAINTLFAGRFTSSRGTVYAGRRLYTLILNYHLPRAFALINGTANGRPYGHNYCMELTAPNPLAREPADVVAEYLAQQRVRDVATFLQGARDAEAQAEIGRLPTLEEAAAYDHTRRLNNEAAFLAANPRRRHLATQDEINRVYALTDGEFERELSAQVAAEERVQNEIDRQVADAVADASAPLTNFPTPLQAALFPTREQVAAHDRRLAYAAAAAVAADGIERAPRDERDERDERATSNEHNERARRNYERTRILSARARAESIEAAARAESIEAAAADNLRNEENARADLATGAAVTRRLCRAATPPSAYAIERFTVNLPTPPRIPNPAYDAVYGPDTRPLTSNVGQTRVSIGHAEFDTPPIVDELPF